MRKAALLPALVLGLLVAGCVVQPVGTVAVDTPEASVRVSVRSYPELVLVPGSPVYYAPWVDQNYFFYDGMYWVFAGDNWYASYWFNGPWSYVRVDYVPVFILRVPVYYYRRPPVYFRSWRAGEPPRWGERWGRDWEERHPEWHRHDGVVPAPAPRPDYQRRYSGKHYPAPAQQQQLREQNYPYRPREHVELVPGSRPPVPQRQDRQDRLPDRQDQGQQRQEYMQQRQDPLQQRREQNGEEREDRQQERRLQRPDALPPEERQPRDDGRGAASGGPPSRDAERRQLQWQQQRDTDREVQEQWRQRQDAPFRAPGAARPDAGPAAGGAGPQEARDDRDEQQRRQAQWQDWQDWQDRQRRQPAPAAAPEPRQSQARQSDERQSAGRPLQEHLPQDRLPQRPDPRGDRSRYRTPELAPGEAVTAPARRELPAPVLTAPERSAPAADTAPGRESRPQRKETPARKPARGEADQERTPEDAPGH